jgi:hypothetical protein
MSWDVESAREAFERDGVVFIPQALSPAALEQARKAYEWSLANPGPLASKIPQRTDALFYQDLYNPGCMDAYRGMLRASPVPTLCTDLWGTPECWFMYEQVFLKEGGESRRTPWHQDASYLSVGGKDLAVAWITFDPLSKDDSLEFIPGSHKGPLYDGSRFDVDDDTAPIFAGGEMPRLPDIEKSRRDYEIVSWPIQPGDLVIFHTHTLHGGAPTHVGARRRTLTLRFFGRECIYERRGRPVGPNVPGLHKRLKHGDAFRDDWFMDLSQRAA